MITWTNSKMNLFKMRRVCCKLRNKMMIINCPLTSFKAPNPVKPIMERIKRLRLSTKQTTSLNPTTLRPYSIHSHPSSKEVSMAKTSPKRSCRRAQIARTQKGQTSPLVKTNSIWRRSSKHPWVNSQMRTLLLNKPILGRRVRNRRKQRTKIRVWARPACQLSHSIPIWWMKKTTIGRREWLNNTRTSKSKSCARREIHKIWNSILIGNPQRIIRNKMPTWMTESVYFPKKLLCLDPCHWFSSCLTSASTILSLSTVTEVR